GVGFGVELQVLASTRDDGRTEVGFRQKYPRPKITELGFDFDEAEVREPGVLTRDERAHPSVAAQVECPPVIQSPKVRVRNFTEHSQTEIVAETEADAHIPRYALDDRDLHVSGG